MKLKSIFCGVAAVALLSACSSDEPVVNNGGGAVDANKTTGYMSVAINLPTQPAGSRANDYFSDGKATEYEVKSSYLILFKGADGDKTNEAEATVHSVYDLLNLGNGAWGGGEGEPDGNITVSYRKTVPVKGVKGTDYLFGLVMLNADGVFNFESGSETVASDMKFGDNSIIGKKFYEIQGLMTNASFVPSTESDNGFFMTNAVLSPVPGGGNEPKDGKETTLVEIGDAATHLYATEAEAEKAAAASFFVERAVGKVTLDKSSNASVGFGKDGIANTDITIESVEWVLDNTKNTSYVVRNLGDKFATYKGYASAIAIEKKTTTNPYRFVGHSPIGQTAIQPFTKLYRTYWAEVPEISNDLTTVYNGAGTAATTINDWGTAGITHPQYCHENTFTVDQMTYGNTTRAILKVKFKSGRTGSDGGLYIANGILYDNKEKALSHIRTALLTPVKNAILANITEDSELSTVITTGNLEELFLNITYETNVNGRLQIGQLSFKDLSGLGVTLKPGAKLEIAESTIKQINANYGVTNYEGGVSYYAVSIKHFGDDLTPWTANGNMTNTSESYGTGEDAAKNYLGRYGIVRNNWYDLQVTSFKKLGEPVVGNLKLDKTPDDDNEVLKYLSFRINILAWAKRSQEVEL